MTIYLDYSATTPVLPEVAKLVCKMMSVEYGNAGSRTHEYGVNAKRAVELARAQVANVVNADKTEVIFTSGATESNNIAILGMRAYAEQSGKKHIITSKIEHKSVLEPIGYLEKLGFSVTYLDVTPDGIIDIDQLIDSLQEDTVLVSIMHVNNETGTVQPLNEICKILDAHDAFLHIDAAQSFGKYPFGLENSRIDFISVSGHKIYAPMGIGALILRRRGFIRPPLEAIYFGGGQEKGLRPGTLAMPLIAGLGLACELAKENNIIWLNHVSILKKEFTDMLSPLAAKINGVNTSPYILNFFIPGVNSEAAMVKLKEVIAVSNGSACTASSYSHSHVLTAMGLEEYQIGGSMRVSFSHLTKKIPYQDIVEKLKTLV